VTYHCSVTEGSLGSGDKASLTVFIGGGPTMAIYNYRREGLASPGPAGGPAERRQSSAPARASDPDRSGAAAPSAPGLPAY